VAKDVWSEVTHNYFKDYFEAMADVAVATRYYCYQCEGETTPSNGLCPGCSSGFYSEIETPAPTYTPEQEEEEDQDDQALGTFAAAFLPPLMRHLLLQGSQFAVPPGGASTDEHTARVSEMISSRLLELMASHPQLQLRLPVYGSVDDYAWGPDGMDQVLSDLMDAAPIGGAPPAPADVIAALPTCCVVPADMERNTCAICIEEWQMGEVSKELPCRHAFHTDCIVSWLESHGTCPICRTPLVAALDAAPAAGS